MIGSLFVFISRIHPISILTFLTATRYAELLFSTGVFASGQIIVCTQGFFYDLPSDPHLRMGSAVGNWLQSFDLQGGNRRRRIVISAIVLLSKSSRDRRLPKRVYVQLYPNSQSTLDSSPPLFYSL